MADDFQDDFIVDFSPADMKGEAQRDDLVGQGLRYSLETDQTDEDVNIAVNLGPLVCGQRRPAGQGTSAMSQSGGSGPIGLLANKTAGNKAARMIPHFR